MKPEIAEIQANVLFIRKFIENDGVLLQSMQAIIFTGGMFIIGFGVGMIIPMSLSKSYCIQAKNWAKKWAKKIVSKLED